MTTYIFEREGGNLSEGNVRKIIKEAKYDPNDYTYDEIDTNVVHAEGPEGMAPSTLEHAAKKLGYKNTGVTVVDDEEDDDSDSSVSGIAGPVTASIGNLLGATGYGVSIAMNADTVKALSGGGYSLYGFKGVKTKARGGRPLVWFKSVDFGLDTDVSWEVQYKAYTSRSEIIPNGQIKGLSSYAADLGQKLEVRTPQGTGTVVAGTKGVISIENLTETLVTCGISEVVDGKAQPLCAFPLYGNGLDAIVPIQKVMLTFATDEVNTGTVIEKAYSQSILIDLTSDAHQKVSYDINKGWSWGGFSWAQTVRPSADIVPLLIETNASF